MEAVSNGSGWDGVDLEKLVIARRHLLIYGLFAFSHMMGSQIVLQWPGVRLPSATVYLLCWSSVALVGSWGVWLVRLLLVFRNRPKLWAGFNDERVQQNRLLSWAAAFWTLWILLPVSLFIAERYQIPINIVFQLDVLFVSLVSTIEFLRRDAA